MRIILAVLLLAALAVACLEAVAQEPPDVAPQAVPAAPDNERPPAATPAPDNGTVAPAGVLREGAPVSTGRPDLPQGFITFKTPFEQWLILMTVATLAVTITALTAMGWRTGLTPDFVRAFIVVVVVFSALFLIAAGYSDKQAAPVYALLGTIVGYIFGRLSTEQQADGPVAPPPNGGNGQDQEDGAAGKQQAKGVAM